MKKIIVSIILFLIVITVLIIGIFKNENNSNTNLTKVTVAEVAHSIFYAPQYVSIANGFFKDEGIEIEITTGQGADNVMTAVLAGQSDIGFAGPEAAIYVYNEGKADYAEVFAQLTKKDGSFLVSRNENNNFVIRIHLYFFFNSFSLFATSFSLFSSSIIYS